MKPIVENRNSGRPKSIADLSFNLTRRSGNSKTGKIATTISSARTCPDRCPFMNECYPTAGPARYHWTAITNGRTAQTQAIPASFESFVHSIGELKIGTMIRFAVSGDLPGNGRKIFYAAAKQMLSAADHLIAWTYTHYTETQKDLDQIGRLNNAVRATVNLSANNDQDVDDLIARGVGPVVTIIDGSKRTYTTAGGNRIVTCPAAIKGSAIDCKSCGNGSPLCAKKDRNYTIGFPVHGIDGHKVLKSGNAFRLPVARG